MCLHVLYVTFGFHFSEVALLRFLIMQVSQILNMGYVFQNSRVYAAAMLNVVLFV